MRFHGWHDYNAVNESGVAPSGVPQAVADNVLVLPTEIAAVEQALEGRPRRGSGHPGSGRGQLGDSYQTRPGSWRPCASLPAKKQVVLIFDEIVSGFRYGPGGIQRLEGVTPDLTCLAKILAGGFPGGAVAGTGRPDGPFKRGAGRRYIVHHGTFNANPLSAAAGIAALSMIADP